MSVENQTINILDLPREVLREILSYVPNHLVVGEVCKTFYQISCKLNTYRLTISTEEPSDFEKLSDIEDDGVYESILNSSRQIDSIYITSGYKTRTMNRLRLRKVLEYIGWHVKELEIFNNHGVSLLNLMPNLEKIKLTGISCDRLKISDDFKLRLNKLKELKISECSEKILEVFERLPDDVLLKCSCNFIERSDEEPRKYFQNQRNIKHIDTDADFLNFNQLKLKSSEIHLLLHDFSNILKGQDELTSLTVWDSTLTDEIVKVICIELKLLEELQLGSCELEEGCVNLEKFQSLKNLKKFILRDGEVECLKTLRSKSLICLQVEKLTEEVCLNLSVNCPNIRELKYYDFYNHNFEIEKILPHLTKLESLCTSAEILTFTEDWENQTLKHICMVFVHDFSKMIEFLKRCKNLKTLSVGKLVDPSMQKVDLKRLLIEVPNLKTLCLEDFDPGNAEIIKEHGQNLECIHQQRYKKREDVEKFAEVLKDHLPVCKIASSWYRKSFVLKKYGKVEKCCDLFDNLHA